MWSNLYTGLCFSCFVRQEKRGPIPTLLYSAHNIDHTKTVVFQHIYSSTSVVQQHHEGVHSSCGGSHRLRKTLQHGVRAVTPPELLTVLPNAFRNAV